MKKQIESIVTKANNLDQLAVLMISYFVEVKKNGQAKIGYVSGLITSEGPENIPKNFARLSRFTDKIRGENNMPIFSPTDVFNDAVFTRFNATGAVNHDYELFWKKVLSSGQVTNMFMTPRWEVSNGAKMEHQIAIRLGMQIIYIDEEI